MMNPKLASQFKKPSGIFGYYVSNFMIKKNFRFYQAIEQYAGFSENMDTFEIGYGPGAGLRYYIDKYNINIDGIDFSKLMHSRSTRKNRKHIKTGKLNITCGDFATFEINNKKYDRVIFANVTYFWDDLIPLFSKIKEMLKDNGKLIFYMTNKTELEKIPLTMSSDFFRHDKTDVLKLLNTCGYKDISAHSVVNESGDFLVVEGRN
jgi:cyclopropane fatty-acyl-phospholipid synthase-like methyltransferase